MDNIKKSFQGEIGKLGHTKVDDLYVVRGDRCQRHENWHEKSLLLLPLALIHQTISDPLPFSG